MRSYTISNAYSGRLERSVSGAMKQATGGHIHHMTLMLVKRKGLRLLGSRPGLSFGRSVMGYDFISLVCARIESGVIRGTVADCLAGKSYEAIVPVEDVRWAHVMYEAVSPLPEGVKEAA